MSYTFSCKISFLKIFSYSNNITILLWIYQVVSRYLHIDEDLKPSK